MNRNLSIKDFKLEVDENVKGKETYTKNFRDKSKLEIVLSTCKCEKENKKSVMYTWINRGYLKEFIEEWIHVETYYTHPDGLCTGSFNPQIIYKGNPVIDFEWLLKDTKENREKILNEIIRLYKENIDMKK